MKSDIQSLSGFPELLPEEQLILEEFMSIIRKEYQLYGFCPIETPAVERVPTLLSKGGNEKEIYALSRLSAKPGERSKTGLALHFDLTVPLARYVAANKNRLIFPFRCYQMQKVWRGERPQAGRYREFYQCDIDVIDTDELPNYYDAELLAIIYSIFMQFNVGPVSIKVNNRKVLVGYLERYSLTRDELNCTLHAIDKIEKVAQNVLVDEVVGSTSLGVSQVEELFHFIIQERSTTETLELLRGMQGNDTFRTGVEELQEVVANIRSLGVPAEAFKIDLAIVRGLNYYTGTVYETKLLEHPELGSVCSGGRYNDLTGLFTEGRLPGVGISIGLSRLVVTLLKKGAIKPSEKTIAKVLVTTTNMTLMPHYMDVAQRLRDADVSTELYINSTKSLKNQLKYANRKGFPFVVIIGELEVEKGVVRVKNMSTGKESEVPLEEFVEHIVKQSDL